jgi:hypothetical protein
VPQHDRAIADFYNALHIMADQDQRHSVIPQPPNQFIYMARLLDTQGRGRFVKENNVPTPTDGAADRHCLPLTA